MPVFLSPHSQNNDYENSDPGTAGAILTETRTRPEKPPMYKVLLLNDDYTPMDFVVHILERFFGKNKEDAVDIMLTVHRKGAGVCGIYTFEVAETKVAQTLDFCRQQEQPLQCTMEKD